MARAQRWLPIAADVITVVVGVIVIGVFATRYMLPRFEPPKSEPKSDMYTGVRLDATLGIDFAQAAKNLVLVVQQGCPACEMSMPFYERITALDEVQVIVAAPPRDTQIATYLDSYGVEPDDIIILGDQLQPPITATPTLFVADSDGIVTHSWIGVLSEDAEAEVMMLLTGTEL